jgi:hypothetical protein
VQKAKKRFWDERFLLAKPLIDRAIQREELAVRLDDLRLLLEY